jgi:transposase
VYFAGIDAHTRYVMVVVVNSHGERVLPPTRVALGAMARLVALLAPFRPLDAVVESSPSWVWLYEGLTAAGIQFTLAHAKKLRAIAEATYKADAIDAELLARMRVAGLIPAVYAAPAPQREWATLIRHREALVRERTVLVNRVHAQLHACGLALERGRLLTRAGWQWVRGTAWPRLSGEQRALVRSHRRLIGGLTRVIRALDRRIRAVAAEIPEAGLLQSIPGIGPQRALLLCAEVLPITRFAAPNRLVSYAGLAPRTFQSGVRPIRHGGIPAGANRWVRGALVRAVVSHGQHAPESWLTAYYSTQKARRGWPVARVAAARKLARAIHAMLRHRRPWQNAPRGELAWGHAGTTAAGPPPTA